MEKRVTYDDYVNMPDDGNRYEIDDGVLMVMEPAPQVKHQDLLLTLGMHFKDHCSSAGKVMIAPVDVKFSNENTKQPDLVFVSNERKEIITEKTIEGAPDLLAEILSPSTGQRDKTEKKATYEQFGVKEYWIIDPIYNVLEQFVLGDGKYELTHTYLPEETVTSPHFSCVNLPLSELFSE